MYNIYLYLLFYIMHNFLLKVCLHIQFHCYITLLYNIFLNSNRHCILHYILQYFLDIFNIQFWFPLHNIIYYYYHMLHKFYLTNHDKCHINNTDRFLNNDLQHIIYINLFHLQIYHSFLLLHIV